MLTLKQFMAEAKLVVDNDDTDNYTNGMSEVQYNFLTHLSSPIDGTHKPSLKESLDETVVITRRPSQFDSDAVAPYETLPRTRGLIDQAKGDIPNENLHKRIASGLRSATEAMRGESPQESKAKLKESKGVYKEFMTSRGYKGTPNLLRGNLKTEKSSGEGVKTKAIFLAPHATSGLHDFDVCPAASTECREGCLGLTAGGNRAHADWSLSSKVARTHFLAKHPEHFARILDNELTNHTKASAKAGMLPGIRLNGTSDIAWEKHAPHMFERHPDIQFYDYSKMANRVGRKDNPENYHLSLSHTGTDHAESNDTKVADHLSRGNVVAMVYAGRKKDPKPTHVEDVKTGARYPIVDGDKDDNTFDRHAAAGKTEGTPGNGVVSGLKLKGISPKQAGKFANKVDPDGIIRINH